MTSSFDDKTHTAFEELGSHFARSKFHEIRPKISAIMEGQNYMYIKLPFTKIINVTTFNNGAGGKKELKNCFNYLL